MFKWVCNLRIALLHATYHRNVKRATIARENHDVIKFKKYIYRAEDAWRKIVILTEKNKQVI
jgi:hypothetical protein